MNFDGTICFNLLTTVRYMSLKKAQNYVLLSISQNSVLTNIKIRLLIKTLKHKNKTIDKNFKT